MYRKCSIWKIPTWVQSELTNKAFLRHVGSKNEVESAHYAHAWALGSCHSASSHRQLRLLQAMPKEKTDREGEDREGEDREDRARPFMRTVDMDPRDPRAQPDWEVMWGRRVERAITMQCASMAEGAG